jgi:hypothetical protein
MIMRSVERFILSLLAAASVLGACSMPAVAGEISPPAVTPQSKQLIGIAAWGAQADLDRLQALTSKSGFPCKQMDAPEGRELLILFPPGTEESAVAAFLDQLRGSAFSTLRFGSVMAPDSK